MLVGAISQSAHLRGMLRTSRVLKGHVQLCRGGIPEVVELSVTPTTETQEIFPPVGKYFNKVTVDHIPNNYGLITYNGFEITVS